MDKKQASAKEARDTVAGCRALAVEDRARAEAADTDNGRQVFERSAASWDARADAMEEEQKGGAAQRAADQALWDGEE